MSKPVPIPGTYEFFRFLKTKVTPSDRVKAIDVEALCIFLERYSVWEIDLRITPDGEYILAAKRIENSIAGERHEGKLKITSGRKQRTLTEWLKKIKDCSLSGIIDTIHREMDTQKFTIEIYPNRSKKPSRVFAYDRNSREFKDLKK